MKKLLLFFTSLIACQSVQANTFATQVCYGRVCQPMSFSSKESVMNELNSLFMGNIHEILFCEANPATRTCQKEGLQFSGQTAHIGMEMSLPFARVVHAQATDQGLDLAMDYQIQANGAYPVCTLSTGSVSFYQGIMQLESRDFSCQLTQGSTKVSVHFQLDFVDFEQKRMGAYYTISSQGEANLNGSGYTLMRLSKNRHMIEQRSVTLDPWKAGVQTPVVRTQSGKVGLGNLMNDGVLLNQQSIQSNQQTWGINPQFSSANGLGGWYLNDQGAYVPMAGADTSWQSQMGSWWEKLKKIVYLEPLE